MSASIPRKGSLVGEHGSNSYGTSSRVLVSVTLPSDSRVPPRAWEDENEGQLFDKRPRKTCLGFIVGS